MKRTKRKIHVVFRSMTSEEAREFKVAVPTWLKFLVEQKIASRRQQNEHDISSRAAVRGPDPQQ